MSRHLGALKKASGKPCYCLFIAPKISPSTVANFFTLHKLDISFYGGAANIVPLPLNIFRKMVEDSYRAGYVPQPEKVRSFFEYAKETASVHINEVSWYEAIKSKALQWLV